MTIEEMKFMESHIIISRTVYDTLKHQIERYQDCIHSIEELALSKGGDGTGLVYTKEIMKILGYAEDEAEPFE